MAQKPYSRTIMEVGDGSLGNSLPRGFLRRHGVEKGDEVFIDPDDDEKTITIHLD